MQLRTMHVELTMCQVFNPYGHLVISSASLVVSLSLGCVMDTVRGHAKYLSVM